MATKTYFWDGTVNWAKVYENQIDPKYKRWSVDFYPDKDTWPSVEESEVQCAVRESESGKFIKLGRRQSMLIKGEAVTFGPPAVFDDQGEPVTALIGNGSHVTVKVDVYDSAKGKGHRLQAVRVNKLVEYIPPQGDAPGADEASPAPRSQSKKSAMPF